MNESSSIEREYFDTILSESGEFNPFRDSGWDTIARCFRQMVGELDNANILDVGCGTGESLRLYQTHCRLYVGIDLSTVALGHAHLRFGERSWVQADAFALPFVPGCMDVVAFSSVLHHLPRMGPALDEAMRVLRRGGRVFAFDPNVLHPAMALLRHPRSPIYLSQGVSPNERPLHPRTIREAFSVAGLTDLKQHAQANIAYRKVAPRLINLFLTAYNLFDRLLDLSGLGRVFGPFVITSGRKPSTGIQP